MFLLVCWYLLHNVCESHEQRLALVLDAVFGTQGLHQRSHLPVVVSGHCGEEAVREDRQILFQCPIGNITFPKFTVIITSQESHSSH